MHVSVRKVLVLSGLTVLLSSAAVFAVNDLTAVAAIEIPDSEAAQLVGGCYIYQLVQPAVCVHNNGTRCPIDSCQAPFLSGSSGAYAWNCGGCCTVPMPIGNCGTFQEDPETEGGLESDD